MKDEDPPRRVRILHVAERLFLHYGPAKTTIADIARACGIGVGSVYLDFASKEAILKELSVEKSKRVAARMREAIQTAGPSPADQLEAALKARILALLDMATDGQHACDLVHAAAVTRSMTACTDRVGQFGEEACAILKEVIEAGRTSNALRCDDVDELVETFCLAFVSLAPPDLYRLDRSVAEKRAARLAMLVVRGVVAA